jgi:hypothetical protein
MIKNNLDELTKNTLDDLVNDIGKPEHPTFLSWMSGFHRISDLSPYSLKELSEIPPEQLFTVIENWEPKPNEGFGLQRISYEGFASEIANLICSNPDYYKDQLKEICLIRPDYSVAILNRWSNPEFKEAIPWEIVISLFENLLIIDSVWDNESKKVFDGETWSNVRLGIARLLDIAVINEEKRIPDGLLENVQTLLMQLVDDPDPTPDADKPLDGWFGHNDPRTVALNHVRPVSLTALIHCAVLVTKYEASTREIVQSKRFLQPTLRKKLCDKLDVSMEPSSAVRSVFGSFIPTLNWLDQIWLIENLDLIFPTAQDDESIWMFISAWDSYILNRYSGDIFEIMKPKYSQAVEYLSQGYTTESNLNQASNLAAHLLFEFLFSENGLDYFITQKCLLVEFFQKTQTEIRSRAPWALWMICQGNPDKLSVFWPKAKSLWEWRNQESIISNHSSDFDAEMLEFAQLLQISSEIETIISLQSLLDGLLPHLRKVESHDIGWRSVEAFLARQVEYEPIEAIKFYRLMCEQKYTPPQWVYHSDNAKKLIEITVANPKSRVEALALIDFFARRWNDYTFESLYQRYSG